MIDNLPPPQMMHFSPIKYYLPNNVLPLGVRYSGPNKIHRHTEWGKYGCKEEMKVPP